MNAFESLLQLSPNEKERLGVVYTPAEIAQQPAMWHQTAECLLSNKSQLQKFMRKTGLSGRKEAVLILTGAGSSEFIGTAVQYALRSGLRREVQSIPTTHLVTHARSTLVPGHCYVVLSFARSGNSPESVATSRFIRQISTTARQLVLTCNAKGDLASFCRDNPEAFCFLLPPETNDQSLVMTSSFSSMAFAAIGLTLLDKPDLLREMAEQAGQGGRRIISGYGDMIKSVAEMPFDRACFLGSNSLYGTMQECHLKMQEMTEGRVACRYDSFLGLRHGPQVFVNKNCVVVAALSSDGYARAYELDLLKSLKANQQGCATIVICDRGTDAIRRVATHVIELYPEGHVLPDMYRVMTDVVAGQMLATFKCLQFGLKPDAPCTTGTIHRVVQGVTIYDLE